MRPSLMMLVVFLLGCTNGTNPNVTGSGVSSSEERSISPVSTVELFGVGSLTVNSGQEPKLFVEADDNMLQFVRTTVEGDVLRLGVGDGTYVWNTGYPRIALEGIDVKTYKLSGQTQLVVESMDVESLELVIEGQCSIKLRGRIKQLSIVMSGQSSIDASEASIDSVSGTMEEQSMLTCQEATVLDVEKNADSRIERTSATATSETEVGDLETEQ